MSSFDLKIGHKIDSFDTKKGKKWRLILIQIGQEMDLLYTKVDSFRYFTVLGHFF
jgi:hypothetical protein